MLTFCRFGDRSWQIFRGQHAFVKSGPFVLHWIETEMMNKPKGLAGEMTEKTFSPVDSPLTEEKYQWANHTTKTLFT
jgi:hypothetical protein